MGVGDSGGEVAFETTEEREEAGAADDFGEGSAGEGHGREAWVLGGEAIGFGVEHFDFEEGEAEGEVVEGEEGGQAQAAEFGVEGAEPVEEGFEGVAGPADGAGVASVAEAVAGGDALAFEGFWASGFGTVGTGGGFSGFGDHFPA